MRILRPTMVVFVLLSILTGALYPAVVTALAHLWFPAQAEGSLIRREGRVVGSRLIGQPFASPALFWSRPSTPGPDGPYDAFASGGSNLARSHPAWLDSVRARAERLQARGPLRMEPPEDLVTASGSGLDPDISPAAAFAQVPRVAQARGRSEAEILTVVRRHLRPRVFGWLGEPVVNVLELDLDLVAAVPTAADHRPARRE